MGLHLMRLHLVLAPSWGPMRTCFAHPLALVLLSALRRPASDVAPLLQPLLHARLAFSLLPPFEPLASQAQLAA